MGPFSIAGIGSIASGISDLFGLGDDSDYQQRLQYDQQKEFAQMGIRWRAEDAKAAGLHPLAAIGAAGASYSPTIVAGGDSLGTRLGRASETLRGMGQNTLRAEVATMTPEEKEMASLALRRAQLGNQLLEAQITAEWASIMGQPGTPTMPSAVGGTAVNGRAPAGLIRSQPSISISSSPGRPDVEAASTPLTKKFDMGGGAQILLPSQQASESLESMGPGAAAAATGISALRGWWHGPSIGPSSSSLPAGYQWVWKPFSQSWQAEPKKSSLPRRPYNPSGLRGR